MGVSRSKEPDSAVAREIAESGCILRSVVGSTVHGLSNPGTDDRDETGVCVEPPEYVIGLRPFEHRVFRTQAEGIPSGPGELDLRRLRGAWHRLSPRAFGSCRPASQEPRQPSGSLGLGLLAQRQAPGTPCAHHTGRVRVAAPCRVALG
jgi:RNA repair pathway DNA polymerase beta family